MTYSVYHPSSPPFIIITVRTLNSVPWETATILDDRFVVHKSGKTKELLKSWGYSLNPLAVDLLLKLLDVNWRRRITAEEALDHPYFK